MIAFPYFHFMAPASLDVWVRLLRSSPRVTPRYWARLLLALAVSAVATILTLPERVIIDTALRREGRRRDWKLPGRTPCIFVLGYYRTGTTHLQYLLACDPANRTPRWNEVMSPRGFVLSWTFLRWFLLPFQGSTRPQDDVAFGPEWPAEEDFALCNGWLASPLVWRMVFPDARADWSRWHDLESLSETELRRWREAMYVFARKMQLTARGRRLLFKTPSNTARVSELLRMFGDETRFVYITREPTAVVRSNVALLKRAAMFHLQTPKTEVIDESVVAEEYETTLRRFDRDTAQLRDDRIVRVTFDDLVSRPLVTASLIHSRLNLKPRSDFLPRAATYLDSVRDYRPVNRTADEKPVTQLVDDAFSVADPERQRLARGRCAAAIGGLIAFFGWCGVAWALQIHLDGLSWSIGVVVGACGIHAARRGSRGLGLWCAAATLLAIAAAAVPVTWIVDYSWKPEHMRWEWEHISKATMHGRVAWNNIFWVFMGVMTAYRLGTRPMARVPGN